MLPESKNIQTIADNIRTLENQINALDVEIPPHASADSGKILSVDSEGDLEWKTEYSYTPPAYSSTEEVNTGQKWIDGRDVYCKVITSNLPILETTTNHLIEYSDLNFDLIIDFEAIVTSSNGLIITNRYGLAIQKSVSQITIYSISSSYSEGKALVIIYYVKPDPVPSTETKSKKGGNKK